MRHSAVLSYALHSEYEADTQRDEEQNIGSQISHCTLDPCWLTPQCVTWRASDPPPTGLKGVRSMSGIQLSHLTLYLLLLRFWTHQKQVLPSLDGGGHTLEASDVISAIFLRIFSPTFSPLPTFGLAKVCLTMERCKREQSYTLWTSKKKLTLSCWQVRQKKNKLLEKFPRFQK